MCDGDDDDDDDDDDKVCIEWGLTLFGQIQIGIVAKKANNNDTTAGNIGILAASYCCTVIY